MTTNLAGTLVCDFSKAENVRVGSVILGQIPTNAEIEINVPMTVQFLGTPEPNLGFTIPVSFYNETRQVVPDSSPPESGVVSKVLLDPQPEMTLVGRNGTIIYYVDQDDDLNAIEPRYYFTPMEIPFIGSPSILIRNAVTPPESFYLTATFPIPAGLTPGTYVAEFFVFSSSPDNTVAKFLFNLVLLDADTLFQQEESTVWFHTV